MTTGGDHDPDPLTRDARHVKDLREHLQPVRDFAERWHAGEWSVSALPEALDAAVTTLWGGRVYADCVACLKDAA